MRLPELINYTGQLLQVERFRDYCPNGLQVEGRGEVGVVVTGVTASMALLERAVGLQADAVIVHHGYFWKGEDARLVGIKQKRVKCLLQNDISLLAYHLPLDAHPELGNNTRLGGLLGFALDGWAGEQALVAYGRLPIPKSLEELGDEVAGKLKRRPLLVGEGSKPIRRIAWCTGAAQDYIELAVDLGVDAFLTGEVSERTVHVARETGIAFIAAGHHATERYGIKALGEHLAEHFGIAHHFIDIDNPV